RRKSLQLLVAGRSPRKRDLPLLARDRRPVFRKMKVGIVGPPDIVAGRVDQLELERVGWCVALDRERKLVIRWHRHAERAMDDGVTAMSVEIEIHAHCLAVSTVRVRMNGDLDTLRWRRRPLRHRIE